VAYHTAANGQSQPVASNATPQGQQLNRRVVIHAEK
jgi:outer membrane protein OmpA-like peptidoglycan-associated protein